MPDLDALVERAIGRVSESVALRPVELEPGLAHPKSVLKILDADHYNWQADRFRKLFAMRFRVKLPPLDQVNMIFYPEPVYAAPIFIFFCLVTKRKVIGHLNVNCPFDDADYRARWVEPLTAILAEYPPFEADGAELEFPVADGVLTRDEGTLRLGDGVVAGRGELRFGVDGGLELALEAERVPVRRVLAWVGLKAPVEIVNDAMLE